MDLMRVSTASEGAWVQLPPGEYKLSADVPTGDAATITYFERDGENGLERPIEEGGSAIQSDSGGGAHLYISAWNYVRAKRAGGSAPVTVRASSTGRDG